MNNNGEGDTNNGTAYMDMDATEMHGESAMAVLAQAQRIAEREARFRKRA